MVELADLRTTRIPLSGGAGRIPALGFGTLIPDPALTVSATRDALAAGFRHFDCAERYGNEREVGTALQAGLRDGNIAREDISSPRSCGIQITGLSASSRLSRLVSTDSDLSTWISTLFTLPLPFNPGKIRIRGIKTAMCSTTAK